MWKSFRFYCSLDELKRQTSTHLTHLLVFIRDIASTVTELSRLGSTVKRLTGAPLRGDFYAVADS